MRLRLVAAATVAALASALLVATPVAAQPPNDNFENATQITALPFTESADVANATYQASEPYPGCGWGSEPPNSVWYAYTPTSDVRLLAQGGNYHAVIAVYTGSTLGALSQLGCAVEWDYAPLSVAAEAGTTYYFQLSSLYPWVGGEYGFAFHLEVAPPPEVSIYHYPYDPSIYDAVQFNAEVYDPAFVYGGGFEWDLGDGTTSTDPNPSHTYAADGDYTVNVEYTTDDGRTGTASTTVPVRTHDVGIVRFDVPRTAAAGQARTISVGVVTTGYAETVNLVLYRAAAGDWQQFATQTGTVSVRSGNRPTTFSFKYTFTKGDLVAGKISFRVVVNIANARDALPGDNEIIAPPTTVTRR